MGINSRIKMLKLLTAAFMLMGLKVSTNALKTMLTMCPRDDAKCSGIQNVVPAVKHNIAKSNQWTIISCVLLNVKSELDTRHVNLIQAFRGTLKQGSLMKCIIK